MNPQKEWEARLDEIISLIYGKDVVSYAYASPAGKLTKDQAKSAINKAVSEIVIGRNAESDKVFTTPNGGISNMGWNNCRNKLRAEQRTIIGGTS